MIKRKTLFVVILHFKISQKQTHSGIVLLIMNVSWKGAMFYHITSHLKLLKKQVTLGGGAQF